MGKLKQLRNSAYLRHSFRSRRRVRPCGLLNPDVELHCRTSTTTSTTIFHSAERQKDTVNNKLERRREFSLQGPYPQERRDSMVSSLTSSSIPRQSFSPNSHLPCRLSIILELELVFQKHDEYQECICWLPFCIDEDATEGRDAGSQRKSASQNPVSTMYVLSFLYIPTATSSSRPKPRTEHESHLRISKLRTSLSASQTT
jgi:hypothetical protein